MLKNLTSLTSKELNEVGECVLTLFQFLQKYCDSLEKKGLTEKEQKNVITSTLGAMTSWISSLPIEN